MSEMTESLASLEALAATLPSDSVPFGTLSDSELIGVPAAVARLQRRLDATAAMAAGEIARRSRTDLGYDGLAQRSGYRTPTGLIQKVTGESTREISKRVRVGVMIFQAEDARLAGADGRSAGSPDGDAPRIPTGSELCKPWLAPVAEAVAAATPTA